MSIAKNYVAELKELENLVQNAERNCRILDLVNGVLDQYSEVTLENLFEACEREMIFRQQHRCKECGVPMLKAADKCFPCRLNDPLIDENLRFLKVYCKEQDAIELERLRRKT